MANDSAFKNSGVYLNYDKFELICYDVGHRQGNKEIAISREEAKAICKAIGLMGFVKSEDNGTVSCIYNSKIWRKHNAEHLTILEADSPDYPTEEELRKMDEKLDEIERETK